MFPDPGPRLFALPPGADFPALLVQGLRDRLTGQPPEALARVTLYVNTARMRRRISDIFVGQGAALLPRIRLITDLAREMPLAGLLPAQSPLRRRLELAKLIDALLRSDPTIAPRSALYDLADSLAGLMDEMQGEGVAPEAIARLNVEDHSAHWARTKRFMEIITPLFAPDAATDPETRQRLVVRRLESLWQAAPPQNPVLIAGSTGSRGTTALLMQVVARLPQGAIVLPGFDFDMPATVWSSLDDGMTAEDHPQYRFHRLMQILQADRQNIQPWVTPQAPNPARNRLISLALRPAPVTDQWLTEGRHLTDIAAATAKMTLIEAANPRAEALAIALILRKAAQGGQVAALISPDRELTRQVTAALDRWRIQPDDSAGRPLELSAPGRLLRHVARLFGSRPSGQDLLVLLKHPLTASGADRGNHLRFTRDLELHLRRHGPVFPDAAQILDWAAQQKDATVLPWATWLGTVLDDIRRTDSCALTEHVARHRARAETLARGPTEGATSGDLWLQEAGQAALALMDEISAEADHGADMTAADYRTLFDAIIAQRDVRETLQSHPRILIWGTLEARVQGADLVILGGLNDGVWPQLPPPDPWMNRKMRKDAGLLLPERRVGLSAHDFQQAIAAHQVVLTRATRNAEAETVPSRWLNRMTNLLGGLGLQGGPEALEAMRTRGADWLRLADQAEQPVPVASAHRPAPRPPVDTRPRELAVTRIETLIRDPYAIYARYILKLFKLNPLQAAPDARLRGSVLHKVLETYVRHRQPQATPAEARAALLAATDEVLARDVPWPAARTLWRARLERAAEHFLALDAALGGTPVVLEQQGRVALTPLLFTLTARPDRIDLLPDGRVHIFDYKTGSIPSKHQQDNFDKQLLLEAAMAERGAFAALEGPRSVAGVTYIGLGSLAKHQTTAMTEPALNALWENLQDLVGHYLLPDHRFPSRRAVFEERWPGDYDHLARFGEWEMTDDPVTEDVG